MAQVISQDRLDLAAIAVHRVLTKNSFDHTFFGGYQLLIMGSLRDTKDVDVVVKKPFLNSFEKVKRAFKDDAEFMVFDGNRTDGIRAIHSPSGVGIDIMLQDLPKGSITLPGDPNGFPFFTPTHMFMKKIECLAVRRKSSDAVDLTYLFDHTTLDLAKIQKRVAASQRDAALANHGTDARVAEILASLDLK